MTQPIAKFDPGGLPLSEKILPQYLREAGYQTFLSGKWHLGHVEKRYFPHHRGFDHFYGHATGGVGYWDHNQGGGHDWQRNGSTVREQGYTTHLITDEAIRLLAKRDKARPTFLYVAYNAPHLPNEAPQAAIDRNAHIEGEFRRIHAAMVGELDAGVGRILAALAAEGILDQTLVLFASDNGGLNREAQPPGLLRVLDLMVSVFGEPLPFEGLEFMRENAFEGGASNHPLRGGKMSVLEGGTRVPAAIWWPGHLETGSSELFVTVQDVLPTLLDAAGLSAKIPSDLDGRSRLAALRSGNTSEEHPDYLIQGLDGKALYRGPWKLILPESPLPFSAGDAELYRIETDPLEAHNVAAAQPEVVEALTAVIAAWPEGESVHGSLSQIFTQPDAFGGDEFLPPWAEAAQ